MSTKSRRPRYAQTSEFTAPHGTSIGRRGYANYIQEMFTLKGDEFEALTAADCEARGEHE